MGQRTLRDPEVTRPDARSTAGTDVTTSEGCGLRAADHLAGRVPVQCLRRRDAQVFLDGEQPPHDLVTAEAAVEQDLDQSGQVFDDVGAIEEQLRNRDLAVAANREQLMCGDHVEDFAVRKAHSGGNLGDGQDVDVIRKSVRRKRYGTHGQEGTEQVVEPSNHSPAARLDPRRDRFSIPHR